MRPHKSVNTRREIRDEPFPCARVASYCTSKHAFEFVTPKSPLIVLRIRHRLTRLRELQS